MMSRVLNNLSIIVRNSKTYSERCLKDYELNFPEQVILMYLCAHSGVNQDTLVKHFQLDKGSIAKTVTKLKQKGYISKQRNPENERENLLSLTAKGEEIITQMNAILSSWFTILYQDITQEEIHCIEQLTEKMMQNTTIIHSK